VNVESGARLDTRNVSFSLDREVLDAFTDWCSKMGVKRSPMLGALLAEKMGMPAAAARIEKQIAYRRNRSDS